LREDLALTGTKHGCELGECGACAVLIDGQPQLSCLVAGGRMRGPRDRDGRGPRLWWKRRRYAASAAKPRSPTSGAAQCGYCTPGILMTAKALLEKEKNPFAGKK